MADRPSDHSGPLSGVLPSHGPPAADSSIAVTVNSYGFFSRRRVTTCGTATNFHSLCPAEPGTEKAHTRPLTPE